jgi:hypothetical protein
MGRHQPGKHEMEANGAEINKNRTVINHETYTASLQACQ